MAAKYGSHAYASSLSATRKDRFLTGRTVRRHVLDLHRLRKLAGIPRRPQGGQRSDCKERSVFVWMYHRAQRSLRAVVAPVSLHLRRGAGIARASTSAADHHRLQSRLFRLAFEAQSACKACRNVHALSFLGSPRSGFVEPAARAFVAPFRTGSNSAPWQVRRGARYRIDSHRLHVHSTPTVLIVGPASGHQ